MSFVAPEYHVLVEAAKDAKVNGGSVSVNHVILSELLAVWLAAQPKEPEPAPPVADQIAVGNAPAPPINQPIQASEPAPPAEPTAVPQVEPEAEAPAAEPEPTIQ